MKTNRNALFIITALSLGSILLLGTFAAPAAFAKPPGACDPWPGCRNAENNGEATIELIECDDDGEIATWNKNSISYKIIPNGQSESTVQLVREGVEQWNDVTGQNNPDNPYTLNEILSGDADITIELFHKVVPGYIIGYAIVPCQNANDGIQPVSIALGLKGLSDDGIRNLAGHEVGHGIGLGHTIDNNDDLMGPSLDAQERKNRVCPSNLDVEGLTASENPYMVTDWATLSC